VPELPEIETIRRDLEAVLKGDRLVSLEVRDPRLLPKPKEKLWRKAMLGRTWQTFGRKGKYLIVELEGGYRLLFHMRMTGKLVLDTTGGRMFFRFASGHVLAFCDERRFGEVWLLSPGERWPGKHGLGPDALSELHRDQFIAIVKRKAGRIQSLLMDQTQLAGIGNIYAQEALFKAGIRPTRRGVRVTRIEATRLYDSLQETLRIAIRHRGSSSRDYRDAYGRKGSAQRLHAVYRMGGRPCVRCGSLLRSIRVGGRGSVYCPSCQS
jgi:formamidopyrimidine-DNA glycosylase